MTSQHNLSITPTQYGIISSLLLNKQEIFFHTYAKIYTANQKSKQFIDSGLEGCLCLVFDLASLTFHFVLYDVCTYELLFNAYIEENFINDYTRANQTFHYFEICNGFVGFHFNEAKDALSLFTILSSKIANNQAETLKKDYCIFTSENIQDFASKGISPLQKRLISLHHITADESSLKINASKENTIIFNQDKLNEIISHFFYNEETQKITFIGNLSHLYNFLDEVNLNRRLDENLFEFINSEELHINNIDKYNEIMAIHVLKDYEIANKVKKIKRQFKLKTLNGKQNNIRNSLQRFTISQKSNNSNPTRKTTEITKSKQLARIKQTKEFIIEEEENEKINDGQRNYSNPDVLNVVPETIDLPLEGKILNRLATIDSVSSEVSHNNVDNNTTMTPPTNVIYTTNNFKMIQDTKNEDMGKSLAKVPCGITEVSMNMTMQEVLPKEGDKKTNILGVATKKKFDFSRFEVAPVCTKMEDKSFKSLLKSNNNNNNNKKDQE